MNVSADLSLVEFSGDEWHSLLTPAARLWGVSAQWRARKQPGEPDSLAMPPVVTAGGDWLWRNRLYRVLGADLPGSLVEPFHRQPADRYVLCHVDSPAYMVRFVGWATRDEVRAGTVVAVGPAPPLSFVLPARSLHDMRSLWAEPVGSCRVPA